MITLSLGGCMSERVKRVNKQALLSEVKGPKVYINPLKGQVSEKPTTDSIPVPKTSWWRANPEGENLTSPIFSAPEIRERIKFEVAEMITYFPYFDLYEDESSGEVFWLGRVDGIGDIKITYPSTYPAQKLLIELLDLEEYLNYELLQLVWSYKEIRPAGAIIVAMQFFLKKLAEGVLPCSGMSK